VDAADLVDHDREDDHGQERLQDRPGRAEERLLVAHLDVAPREEEQELAEAPEVGQAEAREALRRADDDRLVSFGGRCCRHTLVTVASTGEDSV
jgi:hypothetical protein